MKTETIEDNFLIPDDSVIKQTHQPFIEANTNNVSLNHLKKDCTIPVFSKDNECTIAHHEFVETMFNCVNDFYQGEIINKPEIRVSHIIKGRVPSAIGKAVKDLTEDDKTIYYERMMFKIDVPSIFKDVNGNNLSLAVGGVRAYNQENLYSKKSYEKFKIFIGFKNKVCTNLCVSSDGLIEELRVSSVADLKNKMIDFLNQYDAGIHLNILESLVNMSLSERQFAKFLGKCRLYNYLPKSEKLDKDALLLNDGQINMIAKGYYSDDNFSRNEDGSISLWNIYNLLTGANKTSYIDKFLSRSVNASNLIFNLGKSIEMQEPNWYLN